MKIACVQMNSGEDMNANIASAETLVRKAHGDGAHFIALPENAFLMVDHKTTRLQVFEMQSHPGTLKMQQLAKELNVFLLIGSVATLPHVDAIKPVNRSLLIDPKGVIVAFYDKIHLFDVELPTGEKHAESSRFTPGDKVVLVEMPDCKLGMTVCYDLRFPHLFRALAKSGAQIICVPAAFTKTTGEAHWHILLRSRAIETGCYILAPAQCGTHPGERQTYGHSLIIDPWGRVLAEAQDEVGVITAEIDLGQVEKVRGAIPALKHDRDFK